MKQFVAIMLLALTFSVFGSGYDSYLLWMVGDDGGSVTVDGEVLGDSGNYSAGVYALDAGGNRVGGQEGTGYLALFDNPSNPSFGYIVDGVFNISDFGEAYAGIPPSLPSIPRDSLTFYIELLNEGRVLGHSSDGMTYAALSEYITTGGGNLDPAKTWQVSTFVSAGIIPEPNSAMLMLLGLATMALRRRKLAKRV